MIAPRRLPGAFRHTVVGLLFSGSLVLTSLASAADKIIVSGASGQLGGIVVEKLVARGVDPENLILVSRTPEKLDKYADMGASTRFGDFDKPESLPAAYEGGDRMLLISIGGSNRPARHKRAIDAAAAQGVKQIVYTSFVNMENNDMPLADDHRATENFLKESGVAWTFLRNSIYMDGLGAQAAEILRQGRVMVPEADVGIGYVTRDNCAAAAAAVLTTAGHENTAYDITGPTVVGIRELAVAVMEITGAEIEIDTGETASIRVFGGIPALAVVSGDVEKLTGNPPTSISEFLRANRASWDQE